MSEENKSGMPNVKTRAEARRRRILEGAAARLTSITGRELTEEERVATTFSPDIIHDASFTEHNHSRLHDFAVLNANEYESTNLKNRNCEPEPFSLQISKKQISSLDIFFSTRLHIVLYSIVMHIIFIMNNVNDTYIFLPLLMWELVEFFYFQAQEEKTSTDVLTSITGIAPEIIDLFFSVSQKTSIILKDSCLYIFTIAILNLFSLIIN